MSHAVWFARLCMLCLPLSSAIRKRRSDIASNASWAPCVRGMCYTSWGKYRKAQYAGVGGMGSTGCANILGKCPSGSKKMECTFGTCPLNFGTSQCVTSSDCKSYCDLDHAGTCKYTGAHDGSHRNWMSEFAHVPLNKLLVVSAHHAQGQLGTLDFNSPVEGSLEILDKLNVLNRVPGMGDVKRVATASLLPMFSSTQSSNVATLLDRGVRALDLRPYLSKSDNQLHDSHGGRGPKTEDALRQIAAFARANRGEIVFVYFQNVLQGDSCTDCKSSEETFGRLNQAVSNHFGECGGGMLLCNVDVSKTVGSLTALGNVIVHTNSWDTYKGSGSPRRIHWENSFYKATWYETNSLSGLQSRVLDDSSLQSKAAGKDILVGHQWVMTPTADDFIGAISQKKTGNWQENANPHGCQSLACFGEVASAKSFQGFLGRLKQKYDRSNFLMLDFADRKGTMDVILAYNRQYN